MMLDKCRCAVWRWVPEVAAADLAIRQQRLQRSSPVFSAADLGRRAVNGRICSRFLPCTRQRSYAASPSRQSLQTPAQGHKHDAPVFPLEPPSQQQCRTLNAPATHQSITDLAAGDFWAPCPRLQDSKRPPGEKGPSGPKYTAGCQVVLLDWMRRQPGTKGT
ncbi:hypothetical protein MHUMG1_05490 [Metarhizium humberi]|uniref:Uncharacterized protein n=1 Tax=Metarhizium humberi TaxID=2596975 RepID=A0A9P8S7J6_9HYPO|nr:hypothetical protein MHUMG1_05490 [Metarhizium humberi]